MARRGITLIEVCVVIAIIGLLAVIILPAVQMTRELSRRMECLSHLRQIGVAVNNYHSTYNRFPPIGTDTHNLSRSIWGILLSDLGLTDLAAYERYFTETSDIPRPLNEAPEIKYPAALMKCPSDSCRITFGSNYAVNTWGSGGRYFPENMNEMMGVIGGEVSYSSITDGASNTTLAGEFLRGTGDPYTYLGIRPADTSRPKSIIFNLIPGATTNEEVDELRIRCRNSDAATDPIISDTRGQFWIGGSQHDYVFSHFDTPNQLSCQDLDTRRAAILGTASQHAGGVNVVFADGSARFINDDIDLGIWRALGTRSGND